LVLLLFCQRCTGNCGLGRVLQAAAAAAAAGYAYMTGGRMMGRNAADGQPVDMKTLEQVGAGTGCVCVGGGYYREQGVWGVGEWGGGMELLQQSL
jgi:hypothetical protein